MSGWVDLHIKASPAKWPGLSTAQGLGVRAKAQQALSEHPGDHATHDDPARATRKEAA